MELNYNQEERELVKLVSFFKKQSERFSASKENEEAYRQMMETCDKLVEQLNIHAQHRETILMQREELKKLVRDNAQCPKCASSANIKMTGTDKSQQGWMSNKYKCRRCNIEFVWNAPNNPWDMVPYVEHFIVEIEKKLGDGSLDEQTVAANAAALSQMKENLSQIKPVVEMSEKNRVEMEAREQVMADMINKVKKHLMIEKIKMDL